MRLMLSISRVDESGFVSNQNITAWSLRQTVVGCIEVVTALLVSGCCDLTRLCLVATPPKDRLVFKCASLVLFELFQGEESAMQARMARIASKSGNGSMPEREGNG